MENNNFLEEISEEIDNIIIEGTEKFQLDKNSNDSLENLLINLESFIRPFPPFKRKKYIVDISFLSDESKSYEKYSNILKEKEQKDEVIIDERNQVTKPQAILNYILEIDTNNIDKLYKNKLEEQKKIEYIVEENEYIDNEIYNLIKEENTLNEGFISETLDNEHKIDNLKLQTVKNEEINFSMILMEEKYINVKPKTEEEKEKEYMNYLFDKNKKPLDFINLIETKFEELKKSHKKKIEKDLLPLTTHFKNNFMTLNIFKKEENASLSHLILDKNDEKFICFCIQNINQETFLYGGTNKGFIYKFDIIKNKEINKINTKETFVSCIDVYENYLVSGHNNGIIHVFNNENIIENFKDENTSPIISLKIVKINIVKSKFEIVYSNQDRQIKLIFKKKYLLYNKLKCEILLETSSPVNDIVCYNPIKDLSISKKKKMKFGFVTIKNIVIMNISPILVSEEEIKENVLTIIRPNDVDIKEVPQCCFGFGYLPNNNPLNNNNSILDININHKEESPLLIISWGKYIRIYKEEIINEKNKKFILNCVFVNDISIIKIVSMFHSSIVLIDTNFKAKIIMTYTFDNNINKTEQSEIKDIFRFNSCLIGNISSDVVSYDNPAYIPGEDQNKKKIERIIFSNSIIPDVYNNNLIIFCENQIINLRFENWKSIINNFIEKKEIENTLFSVLVSINSNIMKNEVDRENNYFFEFKEQFSSEILYKILNIIKEKITNNDYDLFSRQIFEFTIKGNCFKTLYSFIESLLKQLDIKNIIYENFTNYFFEKKDILPSNFYDEITENFMIGYLTYYCEKNKSELSKNLLNFNLSLLKIFRVNKLLKDQELLEPYIYSCMNLTEEQKERDETYDKEYFKPIEYMFNLFKTKEENNIYNDFIINQNTSINIGEIYSCKGYYGHKILWYCNFLFDKKIYLNEQLIDENSYYLIVQKIALFLISKDTLKLFLNFDSFTYFQIFRKLYLEEELYNIINSDYDENEFSQFLKTINITDLQINELTPKKYLYILIDTIYNEENNFYMKKDLYDFLGDFIQSMENKFCIDRKNILLDTAEFLINYPIEKPKIKIKDNFNCHTYRNEKKFQREIMKLEDKIKNIIEVCGNLSLFEDSDYNKLLESSIESPYYQITLYLHNTLKHYKESLELQLNNKNIDSRDLFQWIDETLQQIVKNDQKENDIEKKGFTNFQQEIMIKLKELASISVSEVSKLVDKWFSEEQENVIHQLDKNPTLQFTYVEKYLESHPVNNNNNNEELKYFIEKKIDLLSSLQQEDKIFNVLKNNTFVCDSNLLEKMKEKKIVEAEIFINYVLGNINSSMNITTDSLHNNFNEILNELNKNKINNETIDHLIQKNNNLIKLGISICKPSDFLRVNETDKNWFDLLDNLYNIKIQFKEYKSLEIKDEKINKIKEIKQMIEDYIENILVTMTDYIELPLIIQYISNKFKKVGVKEIIHLIQQIIHSFRRLDDIFHLGSIIVKKTIFEEYKKFSHENIKGIGLTIDFCDYCKEDIQKENFIIFNCGHKYHKKCCAREKIYDKKINVSQLNNISKKICYKCKIDEIEINLYQNRDQLILNYVDDDNEKSDNKNNEKEEEEDLKRKYRTIMKLNKLKKIKKHNITLMNVMNETHHYGY